MLQPLDVLKIHGDGVLARVGIIDVAHAVRCQVRMAALVMLDLVAALVQPDAVLNEQQRLVIVK